MALADATAEILKLQAGAHQQNYQAGVILGRINHTKEYKDGKYRGFSSYVKAELEPKGMGRAWAYQLMDVATLFTEDEAIKYGIKPLYLVDEIKQAIFPAYQPQALLSGTYDFQDEHGETHTLDFQKDHSEETLKALLAAHHSKPKPAPLATQDGQAIAKVLKGLKSTLDSFKFSVSERKHGATVYVDVHMEAVDGSYSDIFDDLSEKV